MKRLYLYLFSALSCACASAQIDAPKLVLPAPEAFSFTKYGDLPIGLFTGTMNYSIPLMELQSGKIRVPVSLNYASNGVKVDEVPGRTGMSWTLQAGGVITRNIIGKADDAILLTPRSTAARTSTSFFQYIKNVAELGSNTQADEFSYSFAGYSGKFYFDYNGMVRQLTPDGIKIEMSGNMFEFILTTPDGFKYYFGAGATEQSDSYVANREVDILHTYGQGGTTAWYLTKIVSATGDQVEYKYGAVTTQPIEYYSSIQETSPVYYGSVTQSMPDLFIGSGSCGGNGTLIAGDMFGMCRDEIATRDFNVSKVTVIKLDSIITRQGTLKYYYSGREDMPGEQRLDSLVLFSKIDNKKIKVIRLNYVYSSASITNAFDVTPAGYLYKRLFLKEVTFINPENYNDTTSYILDYDHINELPPRLSFSQDKFGYFNGRPNGGLVPGNIGLRHAMPNWMDVGANREPDTLYSQKGVLNKITYPTGGYTTIGYENNTIPKSSRFIFDTIVRSIDHGPISGPEYSTTFNCTQSYKLRIFVDWVGQPPVYDPNGPQDDTLMVINIVNANTGVCGVCNKIIRGGQDYWTTVDIPSIANSGPYKVKFEATHPNLQALVEIYQYTEVEGDYNAPTGGLRVAYLKNYAIGNALSSYKKFDYNTPGSGFTSGSLINDFQDQRDFFYVKRANCVINASDVIGATYILNSSSSIGGFNNDYASVNYKYVTEYFDSLGVNGNTLHEFFIDPNRLASTLSCVSYGGSGHVSDPSPRLIPGAPYCNTGILNGKNIKKTTFKKKDGLNFKIREENQYYSIDPRLYHVDSFFVVRKNISRELYQTGLNYFSDYDINEYWRISAWVHIDSTVIKEYDDDIQTLINKTTYRYDNSNHLQQTRVERVASNGNRLAKRLIYPDDLSVTSLTSRNFNNVPLITCDSVDGILTTTLKIDYAVDGFSNIVPVSMQKSTRGFPLETELEFTEYDSHGNPLEFLVKGLRSALLFDSVLEQNVAGCQHASAGDVAFTSFETSYNGNWTGISIGDIVGQGGLTGNKYYQKTGFSIAKAELNNTASYVVTYWSKNGAYSITGTQTGYPKTLHTLNVDGNTWTLYQHNIAGQSGVTVTGSGAIDELRLYPAGGNMTTYTYRPLIGINSQCDVNNRLTYYEYDGFGRLKLIRDQNKNILKTFDYKYQQQQ